MSEAATKVACTRTECAFYEAIPGDPKHILCHHKEKPHYLKSHPCPLFRLDISKKMQSQNPQDFLKMIRKK